MTKLYGMIGQLDLHRGLDRRRCATRLRARAEKLPKGDALRKRLERSADVFEKQRGGARGHQGERGRISGEEKLREELGTLYGNVNGYEGRPTGSQLDRMGVLAAELEAAGKKLEAAADRELAVLNPQLQKEKLEPIEAAHAREDAAKR